MKLHKKALAVLLTLFSQSKHAIKVTEEAQVGTLIHPVEGTTNSTHPKKAHDAHHKIKVSLPHSNSHRHKVKVHQVSPSSEEISRREWIQIGAAVTFGSTISGVAMQKKKRAARQKTLAPLNITRIWQETSINVSIQGPPFTYIALDPTTFQKKQTLQLPAWVPKFLIPPTRVVGEATNAEILGAATVAGSVVEMVRTFLLYPLATLKTRIQNEVNTKRKRRNVPLHLGTRFKFSLLHARRHVQEGKLYAGLLPALLVTVPATGIYFGTRDVVKKFLFQMMPHGLGGSDFPLLLTAVFVGDVVSLAFRTPFDTLSIRLQAATAQLAQEMALNQTMEHGGDQNVTLSEEEEATILKSKVGNWGSIQRLPIVILTDLPFLFSRIALNRVIIQDTVDVGRYELVVIFVAILCAFLTTPFDVARTRILINSNPTSNEADGGSGGGLLSTFRTIVNEGDGGIQNLFAGWLERVAYLGIGRAALEPLQIISYIAMRDTILLQWFD